MAEITSGLPGDERPRLMPVRVIDVDMTFWSMVS
jgi:hypothetical protein